MRIALDERFQTERARYRLVFTCQDCVYFEPVAGSCAHGYPNSMHRDEAFVPAATTDGMFCKEFEIA